MLRTIGRIIVVFAGFCLAAIVGGAILVTLGLETVVQEAGDQVQLDGEGSLEHSLRWLEGIGAQVVFLGAIASAMTIVPAVLVIIVGEVAGIRSAVYYVIGGGAALACVPLLTTLLGEQATSLPSTQIFQVLATAGFGGGLVYWLIAGRGAR